MASSTSTGTQTSNKRSRAAHDGAREAGQGAAITVPRNIPVGFNNNYTVTLRYADSRTTPISMAGGSDARQWSATGIFDPDITATGHQPLMRDLWASQYDYYAVLAFRYRFEFYNCAKDPITYTAVGTSSQLIGGVTVSVIPSTNTSDLAAMNTGTVSPCCEMKYVQSRALWPEHSLVMEGEVTPGDFLIDASDEDTDKTWTAVGANPTLQRYVGYVINSQIAASLVGQSEQAYSAIQIFTTLEYDVQFTQLNQALRSIAS